MLHNKANSSSWAHFGHDSHTNQKEMIFLILQIPLGSGRRWHILHWVQVPSELLRSSLDGSTIQSYPESTSLGIVAGWSWFFEMYIAPTSNILSSWDWLSSHFGDIQPGATHCRVGPEGVNQLPLGQDLLKPDTLTWRMEAVSTWKGTWFYDWSSRRCSFLLTRHGLKCWWVLLISKNKLKRTRSYDVFRSLRAKKNTVHTLTAAPLVKPGWPRMSSGSPCARGMAVHDVLRLLPRSSTTYCTVATGISPSTTLW